jgi:S-disulfanyl-L-cysteine oxidoreductase SoxD
MTKMNYQKITLISVLIAAGINFSFADSNAPALGHPVSPEEIAKWNISVFPDGEGLPEGEGTVVEGEKLYQQQCIACHGQNGLGASADQLAGAQNELTSDYPEQTIGTYWPYATTIFDVVRRSMPMTEPGSLTNNESYALTAYLLYLNNIIGKDVIMNAATLSEVKMPNVDGFINIYKEENER